MFYVSTVAKKGDVCVLRSVHGVMTAIPIYNQELFKEWFGCFTLLRG